MADETAQTEYDPADDYDPKDHKTGNEVTFRDGRAPQAWWDEEARRAAQSNVDGLKHRLAELEGMPSSRSADIAAAKDAVKEAEKQLASLAPKPKRRPAAKTSEKRPAKAAKQNTLKGASKETR